MAIVVEHEKRKHEILQKALDVFINEGYEDATYQKIADKCGITRTTLYIYFKNKQEIFGFSIKQLLTEIETSLLGILETPELSNEQILRKVMETLIDISLQNAKLFEVLLPYLIQMKQVGKDPNLSVKRRVLRVRHLLSSLLIQGVNAKEFKKINIHATGELLYGLIESSIFRISVLNQKDGTEIKKALNVAIDGILA
ncbi:MAG: TetR/AcrR family transcriptional regulator [Treponema bryantii]|jgi:AcrR family transcriptional regulator|nr:TetR/AcrR family transcriptional regulator [Treponema bryantii]MBR6583311.1 TetR/AcrR family transcriptional regulator [Treponema sp.]